MADKAAKAWFLGGNRTTDKLPAAGHRLFVGPLQSLEAFLAASLVRVLGLRALPVGFLANPHEIGVVPPADPRPRLDSIDLMRGIVMVLMVLDHTKGSFWTAPFDPLK